MGEITLGNRVYRGSNVSVQGNTLIIDNRASISLSENPIIVQLLGENLRVNSVDGNVQIVFVGNVRQVAGNTLYVVNGNVENLSASLVRRMGVKSYKESYSNMVSRLSRRREFQRRILRLSGDFDRISYYGVVGVSEVLLRGVAGAVSSDIVHIIGDVTDARAMTAYIRANSDLPERRNPERRMSGRYIV